MFASKVFAFVALAAMLLAAPSSSLQTGDRASEALRERKDMKSPKATTTTTTTRRTKSPKATTTTTTTTQPKATKAPKEAKAAKCAKGNGGNCADDAQGRDSGSGSGPGADIYMLMSLPSTAEPIASGAIFGLVGAGVLVAVGLAMKQRAKNHAQHNVIEQATEDSPLLDEDSEIVA